PVHEKATETQRAVAATHRLRTLHLKKSRAHPARARVQIAGELEYVGTFRDSLLSISSSLRVISWIAFFRVHVAIHETTRNSTKNPTWPVVGRFSATDFDLMIEQCFRYFLITYLIIALQSTHLYT